ncbi:MAG TPA: hypothetical protein VHL52_08850 [Acidimicrobiia bacterium]|nr:hypothetical protein [Acidimicrobiia bacterium]
MTKTQLPDDVYPDSWCRLPLVEREELAHGAQEIFDEIEKPGGGSHAGLRGPGGVRLHSGRLAELWRPVARYLRQETGISPRVREVAILITAREHESQFEWFQHEGIAARHGVPPETIQAIKYGEPVKDLEKIDALVIEFGRQLFGNRRVTSDLFAEVLEALGKQKLVDLIAIMGQYAATAALLNAVDMQLPPGQEPPLPLG